MEPIKAFFVQPFVALIGFLLCYLGIIFSVVMKDREK